MVAVQSTGCAPIVKAFEEGREHAALWQNVQTVIDGVRVPVTVGDFLILRALRDSAGFAIAVPDEDILAARGEVAREEGLLLCPEGAATFAAYRRALADGRVGRGERAVLFNCGTGLKYPMPKVTRRLDRHGAIDYTAL
jgi:threonine synthase